MEGGSAVWGEVKSYLGRQQIGTRTCHHNYKPTSDLMNKLYAVVLFSATSLFAGAQTISTTGQNTFNPSTLTIDQGQTITVTVTGIHTMTEVDQSVWDMNGNTSNGGFNYSAGTHMLTLTLPGTYYYVCIPHAGSGMKGQITVLSTVGIDGTEANSVFALFPNPAKDMITVTTAVSGGMALSIIDATGREVAHQKLTGDDTIDISALASGNYTVAILNKEGMIEQSQQLSVAR